MKAQGDEPDILPSGVYEGQKNDESDGITPIFGHDLPFSM